MTEKQKTIEQIIVHHYYQVCGNPCGTSLAFSEEAIKIFKLSAKEWLQQKLENYKKATICKTYTEGLNELLDELKKEKQKVE